MSQFCHNAIDLVLAMLSDCAEASGIWEYIGQLTTTVSHEIRNPLDAIVPALYIIKTKSKAADTRTMDHIARIE